jgi:hypothetical protein
VMDLVDDAPLLAEVLHKEGGGCAIQGLSFLAAGTYRVPDADPGR